jgi:hypothetical protein
MSLAWVAGSVRAKAMARRRVWNARISRWISRYDLWLAPRMM